MASLPPEPFRAIVGNMVWTHDGTVWAVWQIDPAPYRYASTVDKVSFARSSATLLRELRGEPLLLSVCGRMDATENMSRVSRRSGAGSHPLLTEITEAYREQLEDIDLRERTYWLAQPLPQQKGMSAGAAVLGAAGTRLARSFGLTPGVPSASEVRLRSAQVVKVERAVTGLRAATADEILWLHRRAPRRGTATEPSFASVRGGRRVEASWRNGQLRTRSFATLGEIHLDEGGRVADAPAETAPATGGLLKRILGDSGGDGPARSPFSRRFVKVTTPDGGSSYQAFLVLADLPKEWAFPGGEWMAALHEDMPFPVDWAIRARITPGRDAKVQVGRKRRQLADQLGEFSPAENDDLDAMDALPGWVAAGQQQLADEHAALDANDAEVEYAATIILGVWGDTLDEAEERAEIIRTSFSSDLIAVRPTGDQIACYAAMLPGIAAPRVVSDYTQYLLAEDLAKAMPFVGGRLGDGTGQTLGVTIESGTCSTVQMNIAEWTRRDISASLGLFAELGAGKSVTLKKLLTDVGATGGRTIGWDRTRMQEQVRLLRAAFGADQVQVADLAAPTEFSLDPLRVLAGDAGAQAAETFITQLLGIDSTTERGTVLAEAIDAVRHHENRSMEALIAELTARSEMRAAADLVRQLRAASRRPNTAVIFDATLPPLDLSIAHIVFATSGMSLPQRHELRSDRHMSNLPFAVLFGRAVLTLTALIAKTIAFSDTRFVLVHADECYWLTREGEGSPGYDTVLELIRDGRKNNAGIILAGHDPEDTGDETLLGLLSAIFVGRQRNPHLARRYVTALGVEDPTLVAQLVRVVTDGLSPLSFMDPETGDPSVEPGREGEFLIRMHNRLGRVKVLVPPVERIDTAIRTTPEAVAVR